MIERANNTEYALASGVFSCNISKALQLCDGLQAGNVFVNTYNKTDVAVPFGGFKQSGFGKDLGMLVDGGWKSGEGRGEGGLVAFDACVSGWVDGFWWFFDRMGGLLLFVLQGSWFFELTVLCF